MTIERLSLGLPVFDEAKHPRLHGKFVGTVGHLTSKTDAQAIRRDGFQTDRSKETGVFGRAVYFGTAADTRHVVDDPLDEEIVHADVHLDNPLRGDIHALSAKLKGTPKSDIGRWLTDHGHDGIVLYKKGTTTPVHVMVYNTANIKKVH